MRTSAFARLTISSDTSAARMRSFAAGLIRCGGTAWRRSVAVADQRERRAVDAAAVLLTLGVVDPDHLDAVVDEPLGRPIPVVDREEDLAWAEREAVDDARVVRVVNLDDANLQLAQGVEEPVWRPLDVDQREVVVDHDQLTVDVEGMAGQRHPQEPDPLDG